MGSSPSKPNSDSKHVFTADTPVNFSENLVKSLQSSSESDGTRAKTLELHIQSRVTSELEKHLAATKSKLSEIAESASKEADSKDGQSGEGKSFFARLGEKMSPGSSKEGETEAGRNLDRDQVQKEISELKKKLEGRRKVAEKDEAVEKARQEVVACLRLNDRRPLDCWKEVEHFKAEVGRLERGFVERNGG